MHAKSLLSSCACLWWSSPSKGNISFGSLPPCRDSSYFRTLWRAARRERVFVLSSCFHAGSTWTFFPSRTFATLKNSSRGVRSESCSPRPCLHSCVILSDFLINTSHLTKLLIKADMSQHIILNALHYFSMPSAMSFIAFCSVLFFRSRLSTGESPDVRHEVLGMTGRQMHTKKDRALADVAHQDQANEEAPQGWSQAPVTTTITLEFDSCILHCCMYANVYIIIVKVVRIQFPLNQM